MRFRVVSLAVVAVLVLLLPPAEVSAPARPGGAAESPEARARQVVAAMTLDEKITELHGVQDSQHYRYVPGIPRLGIPPLRITNGPAGVGPGDYHTPQVATALPAPISLAATFDPAAAQAYGTVSGAESADYANSLLEAPDVNMARVPTSGRTFEGYGEDPYLASELGVADIEGIQRQGVIAEVKHYAANNQEANRMSVDEVIDDRTLHEIYLPHFEAAVRQGHAGAVMCAYPKINGTFACQSPELLQTILRDQWGFDGFVQSDFGATHSTVPSALAGLDLEMPAGTFYGTDMRKAVKDGQLPVSAIDTLLVRRFTVMIRFGLFDRPLTRTPIPARADGATSRSLAEQGTVLLRDQRGALPLAGSVRSVAVIGPYAGAAQTGGGGSSRVTAPYTVSPVAGIRARVPHATVSYDAGTDPAAAARLARKADVAVVMVGDSEYEGADRRSLALGGDQDALVSAVAKANPHTVVVVKSGGPVLMPWTGQVPAIVEAWYPGEEDGNAVAAVLFGDADPGGRLPITFPKADADTPAHTPAQYPGVHGVATYSEGLDIGYRWYDARHVTPLYPFGYGLSYTTFRYSQISASRPDRHGQVTVRLDVTNTGHRAGSTVAQLYVTDPAAAGEPPVQLKGFQRVTLAPGRTRRVTLTLDSRAFSVWNSAAQRWTVTPGSYTIRAGDSSADLPLSAAVRF